MINFVYKDQGSLNVVVSPDYRRKDLSLTYMYDMAILKEHRGEGWGSYWLQSCMEALKVEDMDKASLLVTGENKRALELYRKVGFKERDIDLIMVKRVKK